MHWWRAKIICARANLKAEGNETVRSELTPSLPPGRRGLGEVGVAARSAATPFELRPNALAMPADGPADVGEVSLRKGAGGGLKG